MPLITVDPAPIEPTPLTTVLNTVWTPTLISPSLFQKESRVLPTGGEILRESVPGVYPVPPAATLIEVTVPATETLASKSAK